MINENGLVSPLLLRSAAGGVRVGVRGDRGNEMYGVGLEMKRGDPPRDPKIRVFRFSGEWPGPFKLGNRQGGFPFLTNG